MHHFKQHSWLTTLRIAASFQLIIYAIITISIRGSTVPLYVFAATQPKKEHKPGVKIFCKN